MIVFADATFEHVLLMSACVFGSQVSYYYLFVVVPLVVCTMLMCRLFVVSLSGRSVITWSGEEGDTVE